MAFVQKTWTNRIAEFINRRVLTKEDGATELVTVARSEGQISQEGDAFNADNMNDLEQRIADEFAAQNETFTKQISELNTNLSLQYATQNVDFLQPGVNRFTTAYLSKCGDIKNLRLSWTFASTITANTNYRIIAITNPDYLPTYSYQKFVQLNATTSAWLSAGNDGFYIMPYDDVDACTNMHISEMFF